MDGSFVHVPPETPKTPRELQVEQALLELEFYSDLAARAGIYERECRDCGHLFSTKQPDTGTKWSQLCPSCLQDQL